MFFVFFCSIWTVGKYNEVDAKMYCVLIKNTSISGDMFPADGHNKNMRYSTCMHACHCNHSSKNYILHLPGSQKQHLDGIVSGEFCFVQTFDGKITAVYHTSGQNEDVINFKKSIAAAVQANLKGTKTEEEIDPQSVHLSHYTYVHKMLHSNMIQTLVYMQCAKLTRFRKSICMHGYNYIYMALHSRQQLICSVKELNVALQYYLYVHFYVLPAQNFPPMEL